MRMNLCRSDLNSWQFQLSFTIPKISVIAKYRSSGVLIMVQASGGGDYWGEYGKLISIHDRDLKSKLNFLSLLGPRVSRQYYFHLLYRV